MACCQLLGFLKGSWIMMTPNFISSTTEFWLTSQWSRSRSNRTSDHVPWLWVKINLFCQNIFLRYFWHSHENWLSSLHISNWKTPLGESGFVSIQLTGHAWKRQMCDAVLRQINHTSDVACSGFTITLSGQGCVFSSPWVTGNSTLDSGYWQRTLMWTSLLGRRRRKVEKQMQIRV